MRRAARAGLGLWAALSVQGPAAADGAASPEPPGIVLISVDTLRADHLQPYGATRVHTPHVAALARDASVFERAASPMPMTRPAVFSILTSLYPREHGVLNNRMRLPEERRTLAERLRAAGYRTGAFVAPRLLGRHSGAAQGFDTFRAPTNLDRHPASRVVPEALAWIDSLAPDGPFFLWVHLLEPHMPYAPPSKFRRGVDPQLAASLPSVGWGALQEVAHAHGGDLPQAVVEHARALYRGEVEHVDHWIGRLLSGLATRLSTAPLVALTADHGECLEGDVPLGHEDCLEQGATRIPLLIRHPPQFPAARPGAQASLVDLLPTLVRAAGLAVPEGLSGRPLQDADAFGDRYVLLQLPFYRRSAAARWSRKHGSMRSVAGTPLRNAFVDGDRVGMVGASWKYLETDGRPRVYALAGPGGEREQPSGPDPARDLRLAAALRALLERHPLRVVDVGAVHEDPRRRIAQDAGARTE